MTNTMILEYKKRIDFLLNECYEDKQSFIDEDSGDVVIIGTGNLINELVVEKTYSVHGYFKSKWIGKFICEYNINSPSSSVFYKVKDLLFFNTIQYPVFILNKVLPNLTTIKYDTKKTVFNENLFFISEKDMLKLSGWKPSNKVSFDKRYLYVLKNELGRYKIGVATNVDKRVKSLSISSGGKIEIILIFKAKGNFENYLHKLYKEKRYLGEWFILNEDDIEEIRNLEFLKY